jgi:predicted RNase H-like HicB family nuclease
MSNDHTPRKEDEAFAFPPVPGCLAFKETEHRLITNYGQACAEHVRAPLVEENARLKEQVKRLLQRLEIESEDEIHDGIFCRDATIRGIDENRDALVIQREGLLERIAELETLVELYRKQGADQDARAWIAMSAECEARGQEIDRLRVEVEAKDGEVGALRADKARIDEVQNQSLRIEPFEMRTPGGDDADVGWGIYTHHQQAPHLRKVACHYADDVRAAIDAAIAARKGKTAQGERNASDDV